MHSGDADSPRDESTQAYVAGQAVGAIANLTPAAQVVREMVLECDAALKRIREEYVRPDGSVHTPLCDLLGVESPVLLAGMGGIAGPELVAAVSRAGGLGTFGSALDVANKGPDELL